MRVLEYARSEWLFDGPTTTLSAEKLFFGYNTDIIHKLNTGSITRGNVYYDSFVKPVFLTEAGPDTFKVVTG